MRSLVALDAVGNLGLVVVVHHTGLFAFSPFVPFPFRFIV